MNVLSRATLIASIGFVLFSVSAASADRGPLEPLDTSSPRATIGSFIEEIPDLERVYMEYRQKRDFHTAVILYYQGSDLRGLFDLSQVPPAAQVKAGVASVGYLADILARIPEIDLSTVPDGPWPDPAGAPEYWTIPGTGIQVARMPDGPRKGQFLFSADTVASLPEFHSRIIDQPPLRPVRYRRWTDEIANQTGPLLPGGLSEVIPARLQGWLLGTPVWKAVLTVAAFGVVVWLSRAWGKFVARRREREPDRSHTLLRMSRPALLGAGWVIAQSFVVTQVNIQGRFAEIESLLTALVVVASVAWFVWYVPSWIVDWIIASPRVHDRLYNENFLHLNARIFSLLATGVVLVFGADYIGVPATGLITGVGVGGIALALAAKSSIENLFGGYTLFADRPFRNGDYIIFGATSGVVQEIGPRSTRIRGLDGTMTTVPNGDLVAMPITNVSNRNKCLFHHILSLRIETSRAQLEWLVEELLHRIEAHELVETAEGFPRVRITGIGASAINVDVLAYVATTHYPTFLEVQEGLILDIMKTVEAAGTAFAFPSQTSYNATDAGIEAKLPGKLAARAPELATDETDTGS